MICVRWRYLPRSVRKIMGGSEPWSVRRLALRPALRNSLLHRLRTQGVPVWPDFLSLFHKEQSTMREGNHNLVLHPTSRFHVLGFSNDNATSAASSSASFLASPSTLSLPPSKKISVFLDMNDKYTQTRIQRALSHPSRAAHFHISLGPGRGDEPVTLPHDCDFQWAEYERVDWAAVLAGKHGASSYCVRKGLSRKAQLAHFTRLHICKHPDSILKDTLPQTVILDTWPVWDDDCGGSGAGLADIVIAGASSGTGINRRERLTKCVEEARRIMRQAEATFDAEVTADASASPPIWILKPSTINKGAGIQIIHCYEQVVDICWSESDIREWVLQRYISPPLLLQRKKFHIRAYALAVGAISVYVSRDCLALSSGTRYNETDTSNAFAHITNTAYQDLDPNFSEKDCVRIWNEEDIAPILVRDKTCQHLSEARERVQHVIAQIEKITAELFGAYKTEFGVFAPIEDCFEQYGLDFVVDQNWRAFLLEINPGPDFKQTGERLSPVIENLMGDTADVALLCRQRADTSCGRLALVYESDARGRRKGITMKLT